MQFTIDSDQEIDIQDNLTDDEDESLEGPIFQLQFEDENVNQFLRLMRKIH